MPVIPCQKDNKPGFKWGRQGVCFTQSKDGLSPREQAARVGRAIAAQGFGKDLAVGDDAAGGFLVHADDRSGEKIVEALKVFPTIAEASLELLVELSLDLLVGLHERLHHLWGQIPEGEESGETEEGTLSRSQIINAHALLASEMDARGRPIPEDDEITQAMERLLTKIVGETLRLAGMGIMDGHREEEHGMIKEAATKIDHFEVVEAYEAHLKDHGFELEDNKVSEIDVIARDLERTLFRVSDGYGEFYFLQDKKKTRWVAQKMPDAGAYAISPGLKEFLDARAIKELGWGDKAWDKKLTQIMIETKVKKGPEEEGGTRSSQARKFWKENWHKHFPESGEGRFVYHHHWRGLGEGDTGFADDELMKADGLVHGDLRFSFGDGLWGFTVFLGKTGDNRDLENQDQLIDLPEGECLEGAFKLPQSKDWLHIGRAKPIVVEPSEKFFAMDHGTYEMGVWKQSCLEVFLNGSKMNGRYLFQFATSEGRRTWIIHKPEDQTPFAEVNKLEDEAEEELRRNRDFIVWAKPGERPKLINLKEPDVEKRFPISEFGLTVQETFAIVEGQARQFTQDEAVYVEPSPDSSKTCGSCRYFLRDEQSPIGRCQVVEGPIAWFGTSKHYLSAGAESAAAFAVEEEPREAIDYVLRRGKIIKVSDNGKFVLAPALVPEEEDLEGDVISAEEIEKAAHDYVAEFQNVGIMHQQILQSKDAVMVESYIMRADVTINGVKVKKGTWMAGFRILNEKIQQAVRDKKITGISIGGIGTRTVEKR